MVLADPLHDPCYDLVGTNLKTALQALVEKGL